MLRTSFWIPLLLLPLPLPAQTIVGRVLDSETGRAVAGAELALLDSTAAPVGLALSDEAGWFRIQVARNGAYRLEASGPGYATLTLDSLPVVRGKDLELELRLGPQPIEVEDLDVVTRRSVPPALRDYYWRLEQNRKTGRGIVLDRFQLAEMEGHSTRTVVLRQPFARLSSRGGPMRILLKRRAATIYGGTHCEPSYYLDGQPTDALAVLSLPVRDLEGIEIYRGGGCGTILAWLRRTP